MKKLIKVAVLLFCFSASFSQNKKFIDSVLHVINQTKEDSIKFKLYYSVLSNNSGSDEEATYSDSCLAIALRLHIPKYIITSYNQKGTFFFNKGENRKALLNYFTAYDICKQANNKTFMSKLCNNIANCYDVMGIYDKSLAYYFQALKLKQELNLIDKIYITKLNIATVYYDLKEYQKAITYGEEALPDCIKYKDKVREAVIYHNLANNYADLSQSEKAITYYEKAVAIALETEDNNEFANSNLGLAHCYFALKDYSKVLKYTNAALEAAEKDSLTNHISSAKNELGEIYIVLKQYGLAEANLLEGLRIAKEIQSLLNVKDSYQLLSKLYTEQNKFDKALTYYQLYSSIKDSLINDNKSQLMANLQENYEIDKKETENKLLQTQNELSGKTIKQQKLITYFIIGGLILSLSLAFFIFRGLKAQRKANIVISKQKEEVHRQKEIVEEKQKEIIDSITYAKRIQTALLTSERYMEKALNRLNPKD